MKKVSKKKLIEILTNKSNFTYNELSILTGYHPKSLTRIHSMIKKGKYNINKNKKEDFGAVPKSYFTNIVFCLLLLIFTNNHINPLLLII